MPAHGDDHAAPARQRTWPIRTRFISLWGRILAILLVLIAFAGLAGLLGMIHQGVDAGTIVLAAAAMIPAGIAIAAILAIPIATAWVILARIFAWEVAPTTAAASDTVDCMHCGYDLTGVPPDTACPECGEHRDPDE